MGGREFFLVYQRIVDTTTGRDTGNEALLRWQHPTRGTLTPSAFLALAEETGCIIAIGNWLLNEACREAASWEQPLTIAVNVSPIQFSIPNLYQQVADILAKTGLSPERLELEITNRHSSVTKVRYWLLWAAYG